VDPEHCRVLLPDFKTLFYRAEVILHNHYLAKTKLNEIWEEGVRAHADRDFDEKQIPCDFNTPCDTCGIEIEFVMFECLCCRSFAQCEECYLQQKRDEHGEHTKQHPVLRVYDYQSHP
jgi:hypothetical protein